MPSVWGVFRSKDSAGAAAKGLSGDRIKAAIRRRCCMPRWHPSCDEIDDPVLDLRVNEAIDRVLSG